MSNEAQKVALPAFLKKRLHAFRIGQGAEQSYLIKDPQEDQVHQLETWQFFLLEVLPGCEDMPKLKGVFEDRFGHAITDEQIEELFTLIADKSLFGITALSNPILKAFQKKRAAEGKGRAAPGAKAEAAAAAAVEEKATVKEPLPPGIEDVIGLDTSIKQAGLKLFNPKRLIKLTSPIVKPISYLMYAIPLMLIAALFLLGRYFTVMEEDITLLLSGVSIIEHALFSMLTVNLSVTFLIMYVAHSFRASVNGLGIVFYLGFFPRFCPFIGNLDQLSRRERMWLHAAPLIFRLGLFSTAILMWFNTRDMGGVIAPFSLVVAVASALSFLITVNPLVKSSGYHLVATILDEPQLRKKAYGALMNKLKGDTYKEANGRLLAAYALASTVFMIVLFGLILLLLGKFLKIHLGGAGVILTFFVAAIFAYRMFVSFARINQSYDRASQFKKWRDRTLVSKETESQGSEAAPKKGSYVRRALLIMLLGCLFLPYAYEPGGSFVLLPNQQQEITSDLSGLVDWVKYDGGEELKKGEAIAALWQGDYSAKVKVYEALMKEQQAVIDELKSRPRKEDVLLAERALETEETRTQFSLSKLSRLEKLYKSRTVSYEELDDARREYRIDLAQVAESKADLEVTKLGATLDQIAAAQAKLEGYEEEYKYYNEKVKLSTLHMPFDGRLVSMHLRQKVGSYLAPGEPFAIAENTSKVLAEIEIPEADIPYVKKGASVRGGPQAYHSPDFIGTVLSIDSNVTEERYGRVVKVITILENSDQRLKTGMTGYAKIESETLPVWEVLSMAIIRFVEVEVWSWLP